jgi:hypothetical protein
MRQPASASEKEKLAYVEEVIQLLDMEAYADATVGVPGVGSFGPSLSRTPPSFSVFMSSVKYRAAKEIDYWRGTSCKARITALP